MKPRVLIVDDEANIRRMLAALLKSEGFEAEEAAHGNAALLSLDQLHPDAILLDLQMPPGPDGLETLRRIRKRDPSTLVVMMSGKAQLNDAVQAIKLGAFQFLEKPLTPEAVLVALRSGLELTRARAENRALRSQLGPREDLVGRSAKLQEVRANWNGPDNNMHNALAFNRRLWTIFLTAAQSDENTSRHGGGDECPAGDGASHASLPSPCR